MRSLCQVVVYTGEKEAPFDKSLGEGHDVTKEGNAPVMMQE